MKKEKLKPILLIVFAVVAAYVACMPTGVAVYDLAQSQEPFRCSYFNLLVDVKTGICLPLAALGACVNLMTAGIYLAVKKPGMVSFVKVLSVVVSILAVVPILVKDPAIQLVPNMLLPIAMIAEYVVAYDLEKKNQVPEAVKLKGTRKK